MIEVNLCNFSLVEFPKNRNSLLQIIQIKLFKWNWHDCQSKKIFHKVAERLLSFHTIVLSLHTKYCYFLLKNAISISRILTVSVTEKIFSWNWQISSLATYMQKFRQINVHFMHRFFLRTEIPLLKLFSNNFPSFWRNFFTTKF